jgi:hypothetical protein
MKPSRLATSPEVFPSCHSSLSWPAAEVESYRPRQPQNPRLSSKAQGFQER